MSATEAEALSAAQERLDAAVADFLVVSGWHAVDAMVMSHVYVISVDSTGLDAEGNALHQHPLIVGPEGRINPSLAVGMLSITSDIVKTKIMMGIMANEVRGDEGMNDG